METFLVVKWIHVTAAFVSVGGFVLRGVWMLENSPLFSRRWVRIAPHVVDTVLLASAIALAATPSVSVLPSLAYCEAIGAACLHRTRHDRVSVC